MNPYTIIRQGAIQFNKNEPVNIAVETDSFVAYEIDMISRQGAIGSFSYRYSFPPELWLLPCPETDVERRSTIIRFDGHVGWTFWSVVYYKHSLCVALER